MQPDYRTINNCEFTGYVDDQPVVTRQVLDNKPERNVLEFTLNQNNGVRIPCFAFNTMALKLHASISKTDKIYIKTTLRKFTKDGKILYRFVVEFMCILEKKLSPVKLSCEMEDLSNYLD